MKKKVISAVLAAMMVGTCVAGCGSSGGDSGSDSGNSGGEVTTIQWWEGIPEDQGPQDVVDAFNEEHDDIQVEYVRYTNDDAGNTKLDMSPMAGGDALTCVDLLQRFPAPEENRCRKLRTSF